MQGTDQKIIFALPVVALLVAFWVFAISPKLSEKSDLQAQIDTLNSSIDANEAQIAAAESARDNFPRDYARLIRLGRAVPEGSDQATFVYEISQLGRQNDLVFQDFELLAAGSADAAPPITPADASTTSGGASSDPAAAAIATEAAAAVLPIGSGVGPAGLPVMPYGVTFRGSFFDIADFLADLDSTVETGSGVSGAKARGRLMTIDSFALTINSALGFPSMDADLALTTYITPAEQGLAAGATPAGPAPAVDATQSSPVTLGVTP